MNISFFLQPKCKVAYIYNDDTIRQGLQKMNYYGYSAIPVLDENEHYVGTITEGDFLWHICRIKQNNAMEVDRELTSFISDVIIQVLMWIHRWKH